MDRKECFGASGRNMPVSFSEARQNNTFLKAPHFCTFSNICLRSVLITDEDKSASRDRRSLCQRLLLINSINISVYHFVCCSCHLLFLFL